MRILWALLLVSGVAWGGNSEEEITRRVREFYPDYNPEARATPTQAVNPEPPTPPESWWEERPDPLNPTRTITTYCRRVGYNGVYCR